MKKLAIIQKVGDRDKSEISIKDIAFTIPANPMSDRFQALIEYEKKGLGSFQEDGLGDKVLPEHCGQEGRFGDAVAVVRMQGGLHSDNSACTKGDSI